MKKLLLALATILLLVGCSHTRWTTISVGADKDEIIQKHFPELYQQSLKGEVKLYELETRTQKDGSIKYRLSYKEVYEEDDDDELLLWLTIYLPAMMN